MQEVDCLVIGSGFGGAVSALRMAEKGYGVVVLEQVLAAIEAVRGPLGAVRLPQVKFLQPLLPGERAEVELTEIAQQGEASRWRFRVLRGTVPIASGELVPA